METSEGVWEYNNQQEWLKRVAKSTLPPLIITVATTGGVQGKEINPNHPETMEETADQTAECYKLGASIVHLHCRNPDNPAMTSSDPKDYWRLNGLVREKCPDIIINNTTGGGQGANTPEERIRSLEANPEMCSFNMGPLAFRGLAKRRESPLSGRPEDIPLDSVLSINYGENEMYAKAMLERGIIPEMEVYHPGQWWLVYNVIEKGLVKPPYDIQFCMGMSSGSHPTPKQLLFMLETAPMPSVLHVLGVGHYQTPMITMGILLGIHVRTGMEDNVLYRKGELCQNNAQLVERVVRIAKELGREIATPKQARQMLGISEKPSKY
ncbi:3-keto-5-aminohexanoate cleavage protein [Chloroflexota bacterium]